MARRFTSASEFFNWWSRMRTSASAGISAMRRSWNNQAEDGYEQFEDRSTLYDRLWEYYTNTMWEAKSKWEHYNSTHGLYRYIRPIYNPIARLDAFYQSIYPGVLSSDARPTPDGAPLAIPLSKDTSPELRAAIGNAWRWSNWQDKKGLYITYAHVTGNVPVRITDDLERRQVYPEVLWPGHIKDLTLDAAGNVRSYVLEFDTIDRSIPSNPMATYTESIDGERIYKRLGNRVLQDTANPYGFVPMIWWKFHDTGGAYGAPAFFASIGKIDELNHLMSLVHDEVFKTVGSPILLTGMIAPQEGTHGFRAGKRGSTSGFADQHSGREGKRILYASNESASMQTLPTNVGEALELANTLQKEIENDYPELTAYVALRDMTQTTGPAVDALSADVRSRFLRAAASADQQQIKLWQMVCAIAGMRVNSPTYDWGFPSELDPIRRSFQPFNLGSYENGDLDFSIDMRPLVYPSNATRYAEEKAFWEGAAAAKAAGIPVELYLKRMGWSQEQIDEAKVLLGASGASTITNTPLEQVMQDAEMRMQERSAEIEKRFASKEGTPASAAK